MASEVRPSVSMLAPLCTPQEIRIPYRETGVIIAFKPFNCTGVNAGVMLMNLTRMRQFRFQKRAMAAQVLYDEKISLADQDIVNIIFHTFPGKFPLSISGAKLIDSHHGEKWRVCLQNECTCWTVHSTLTGFTVATANITFATKDQIPFVFAMPSEIRVSTLFMGTVVHLGISISRFWYNSLKDLRT